MLSLAVTHFNRLDLLVEAIENVVDDPRVNEVIISDDASTDGSYERLTVRYGLNRKVSLYRNEENVDTYVNKRLAVERARGPWVILWDSDNVLPVSYLDAAIKVKPWRPHRAYLPTFAEPEFDYRPFSGMVIDRHNVAMFMDDAMFRTALNTGNYLIHRSEYLNAWDGTVTPYTSEPIYTNLCWLEAGNELFFVPEMQYFHRIHGGSHFQRNAFRTGGFAHEVEERLRALR